MSEWERAAIASHEDSMMSDHHVGLYNKYRIERTDGFSALGGKHADCEYFVLDLIHDKHVKVALLAYADSCESEYPLLARDLRARAILASPLITEKQP